MTWTFDTITDELIQAYVAVIATASNIPVLDSGPNAGTPAVYGTLGLPLPTEPFPAVYVYVAGIASEPMGTGVWLDRYSVTVRILGGQVSPGTIQMVNGVPYYPERAVYQVLTGVVNVLRFRRFLENPITGVPFRYLAPREELKVGPIGRITAFQYAEQGGFVGIEVQTTVGLSLNVGRNS